MYLDHFNLREKPFKISTDPRFLWLGGKHKEALTTVRHGILYNDGYVVVTGDVGTGKTTLATALINELGDQVVVVKVPYPDVGTLEFFKLISAAYGIADDFHSKGSFLVRFESFLRSCFARGKKVVLIIDEAQTLSHKHLEELLHLSNIEQDGTRLLNIVFVGQNEFNDILTEESNKALRQRVAMNCNLGPLTEDETGEYILHRLKVAQCEKAVFSAEAIRHIFRYSQGIPRLINIACDLALLTTYFEGRKIVERKTVEVCVQRLRLPGEPRELSWSESGASSGGEERAGEETGGGMRDEVRGAPVQEKVRKPVRMRVAVGVAFGLLVFLFGVGFLVYRQVNIRQTSTYAEPETKAAQAKDGRQTETGVPKGKDVPGAPSASRKERTLSGAAGGDSERVARQQEPGAAKKSEKTDEAVVPSARTGDDKSVESAPSAGPAEKTSSDVPRERGGLSEEEKGRSEKGKTTALEDRGEKLAPSPDSRTEDSAQEAAGQQGEGMEPDKLIEWVLEKRSEKQ